MQTTAVFLKATICRKSGLVRGYHKCAHERKNDWIMMDDNHQFWSVPKRLVVPEPPTKVRKM